jgi:hypothetical protein
VGVVSGPAVGVINIRWDDQTASYRVDRPNWNGGKVAMYDDVAELIEALEGMVSIHDSVTIKQESERRDEWLPKARAALARVTGATK